MPGTEYTIQTNTKTNRLEWKKNMQQHSFRFYTISILIWCKSYEIIVFWYFLGENYYISTDNLMEVMVTATFTVTITIEYSYGEFILYYFLCLGLTSMFKHIFLNISGLIYNNSSLFFDLFIWYHLLIIRIYKEKVIHIFINFRMVSLFH